MNGKIMLLSHFPTIREGHVAWLNSDQWFGRRKGDGQKDGRLTHERTHRKIMLLLRILIMRKSHVESLV